MRAILNLIILLAAVACNTTEQTSVELTASENTLRTETFVYRHAEVDFIQNTTTINNLPTTSFSGYFFKIFPNLPDGIRLNTSTGEIYGEGTGVSPQIEYLIEATKGTDRQYAFVKLSVVEEAPKTIAYQYSALTFTYNATRQYQATLSGGIVTNFSASPPLPSGFTIDANGIIKGTPTSLTSGFFTITAANTSGSASVSVLIQVEDIAPNFNTCTNNNQTYNVGTTITPIQCSVDDPPKPFNVNYAITPKLPAGLNLDTSTGLITGSATESSGVTSYLVTAYNSTGSDDYPLTLTINDPAFSLTYPVTTIEAQIGEPITPVPIQAYIGGTPVTYSCTACPIGITVNVNTGLISGTTNIGVSPNPVIVTATGPVGAGVTANMTINVVENYPTNYNDIGYNPSYQLYEDQPASIIPSVTGGMPTTFVMTPNNIATAIPGLAFNPLTGEISGTPISAISATTFIIDGYNEDETGTPVKRGSQTVSLASATLPPSMLGYIPTGSAFYNATTKVFELQDGSNVILGIQPNITAGGLPTIYSISPALPNGLTLNPLTGYITGVPNEIKPVIYYTINGANGSGSFSETIAISTNTLIAPISLSYGAGTNILNFTIFTAQSEPPSYIGSQGSYSVTPALPAGLNIDPQTGNIVGTPIIAFDVAQVYNVTITNQKGALTVPVTIAMTNYAPVNLSYTDVLLSTDIVLTEGDIASSTNILYSSDYDLPGNTTAGYITSYSEATLPVPVLGGFGLTLNLVTGEISGTAAAPDKFDLSPAFVPVSINGINTVNFDQASLRMKVLQPPPNISYNSGTNTLLVRGDKKGNVISYNADNDGGVIATHIGTGPPVPGNYCNALPLPSEESYDINAGAFTFDPATCSFQFDGTQCFDDDLNGDGKGDSRDFNIVAQNSGSVLGISSNLTVQFYDGPNFKYEPDSETIYQSSTNLVLDGTTSGNSYFPDPTDRCHVGDYTLTDLTDLPTPFTFNATTAEIVNNGQNLLGRRTFELSSVESNSGLNLSQSESISVQTSHIESHAGVATHLFEASKFDFDQNGYDDIIIRNTECDDKDGNGTSDGPCVGGTVSTSIYLQSSSVAGLFQGTLSAAPALAAANAVAFTPMQYDVSKVGVIYVTAGTTDVVTRSTDNAEIATTALPTFGSVRGIIPTNTGIATGFGVLTDTGTALLIDQFTITGSNFSTIAPAGVPTITILDAANGGIDIGTGAIQVVTYNDTDSDGNMDIVIGYVDQLDANKTKICIIKHDGTNFLDQCSPRLEVPNGGNITEIKFKDLSGDSLDDMVVLANDGVNNTIYVYENQNNTFAGLFTAIDLITLQNTSSFVNFDLEDTNADGLIDIVTNDLVGDIDGDGTVEPLSPISGLSVYYNTGVPSNIYNPIITTSFPTSLNYSMSAGDNNDVEVISFGSTKLIFHCQIDTDAGALATSNGGTITAYTNSSCGIIGSF